MTLKKGNAKTNRRWCNEMSQDVTWPAALLYGSFTADEQARSPFPPPSPERPSMKKPAKKPAKAKAARAAAPAPPKPRPCAVVVLAAGQGTRMKSALPKVLHPIAGRPKCSVMNPPA